MPEHKETAPRLPEVQLRALRVLLRAHGRARRSHTTELLTQDHGGRRLRAAMGFVEEQIADSLIEQDLAESEPSGEFIRITEAGRMRVYEADGS